MQTKFVDANGSRFEVLEEGRGTSWRCACMGSPSTPSRGATRCRGTVNLLDEGGVLAATPSGDLSPSLKSLGPGSSTLGGRHLVTAEVE